MIMHNMRAITGCSQMPCERVAISIAISRRSEQPSSTRMRYVLINCLRPVPPPVSCRACKRLRGVCVAASGQAVRFMCPNPPRTCSPYKRNRRNQHRQKRNWSLARDHRKTHNNIHTHTRRQGATLRVLLLQHALCTHTRDSTSRLCACEHT